MTRNKSIKLIPRIATDEMVIDMLNQENFWELFTDWLSENIPNKSIQINSLNDRFLQIKLSPDFGGTWMFDMRSPLKEISSIRALITMVILKT